jgi:hypothetical protein
MRWNSWGHLGSVNIDGLDTYLHMCCPGAGPAPQVWTFFRLVFCTQRDQERTSVDDRSFECAVYLGQRRRNVPRSIPPRAR